MTRLDSTIARMRQLEQTNRRMEAILNSSSDAILLVDMQCGIQQVNFAFCELLICDHDTYFGKSLDTLLEAAHIPQLHQALSRVIDYQQTIKPFEIGVLRTDQSVFAAEMSLAPVRRLAGEDQLVICTIRDISERKIAEMARAEAEKRYRGLFEQSNDGVILLDENGKHLQVNQRAADMFGYTVDELLALSVADVSTDVGASRQIAREIMQTGHVPPYTRWFRKKNGETFAVEVNAERVLDTHGNFSHIQSVMRDLSYVRRMEQTIHEKDQQLERFFTSSLELLSIASIVDGRFIRANVMWQEAMGYAPHELHGLPMLDIIHPDDMQKTREAMERLRRDHILRDFVNRCRHRDGAYHHLEWRVVLHGDLIYAAARDITEQLNMIDALHHSEQRLQATLAAIPDMVFRNDLEGTYLGYHGPVKSRLAVQPDFFIGKRTRDVLPPDLAEIADRAIHEASQSQKPCTYEYSLTLPEGMRDFEARSVPINNSEVLTIVRDVTDQKQMDRDLRESETRFRQIAENINQIFYVRSSDRRLLYLSPAYEKIFGRSCQSLYDDPLSHIQSIHPDDVRRMTGPDHPLKRLSAGKNVVEYRIVRPDGEIRWIEERTFPVYDEHGEMIRYVGIVEDITRRKESEEMLKTTLEREKELSELKSRFVSMASHEFRTPLAAILATTETLRMYRDRLDEDQINHRLDKIRRQVKYMQQVMDNLLNIARAQAGKIEFSARLEDLDLICQDIIEEYHSRPSYEGRIQYRCDRAPVFVEVDGRMMRQILSNLLSNALKYSSSGVLLNLSYDEHQTTIRVEDSGIGIPPEELDKIGQPFHRAQNVGTISGTGLGLNITRQAVQAHSGNFQINSEIDVGTTCIITLPNTQPGDVK